MIQLLKHMLHMSKFSSFWFLMARRQIYYELYCNGYKANTFQQKIL
jgi:hypothetical protein